VLSLLRVELTNGFPKHPGLADIPDATQAEKYIVAHPWYVGLPAITAKITGPGYVQNELRAAHARFNPMLTGDEWRRSFCGKEIFRDLRDWVYDAPMSSVGQARDGELARAIARWQVANGKVPQEVLDLRQAVRVRAGL
jgi:hypothetical protein